MGQHLRNRRALLAARGRPMLLRRQAGVVISTVTAIAFARAFNPGEIAGGVQQGDVRIETLADEMAAAAWPVPPKNPDRITMDGRTYTVIGATGVYEGPQLIGYSIWARGA